MRHKQLINDLRWSSADSDTWIDRMAAAVSIISLQLYFASVACSSFVQVFLCLSV